MSQENTGSDKLQQREMEAVTDDRERFKPITPEMAQMMERRLRQNLFADHLGVRIVEIREGYSECELEIREEFLNPSRVIHGGCIYTLADVTVGNAAASYGMTAPTLDSNLHFMANAKGVKKIKAVAKEIHHGRTVMVFSVSVFDDTGRTFAAGTFSFFNTNKKFSF